MGRAGARRAPQRCHAHEKKRTLRACKPVLRRFGLRVRAAETAGKTRITVVKAIDEELVAREGSAPEPEAPPAAEAAEGEGEGPGLPPHVSEPPPVLPEGEAVTLAVAELQILGADYTGELCEIRVGKLKFTGRGETREAAYRSAVGAWLASEGKALA